MRKIIYSLKSEGFDTESDLDRINAELKQMGVVKFLFLSKYKHNIEDAMELYISDMRISRFFWRHIRRLEVNAKAVLLNYFFEIQDLEALIWEPTEEVDEDGVIVVKKLKRRINKEFALKYLKYSGDESKRDAKTIKDMNSLIYNYKTKNSNLDVISFVKKISLGKFIDFVSMIDPNKVSVSSDLQKFFPLKHLVSLRNEISHFHLLCEKHTKSDLIQFWKTITDISELTEKTNKNNIEFQEYIKNFNI